MSKIDKLIAKLKSNPKNFTYDELRRVLSALDYTEETKGKTSGSRVAFINSGLKSIIRLHKPHPDNELKGYQIKEIVQELKTQKLL